MNDKTCPFCAGREFFLNTNYPAGTIAFGLFKGVHTYSLICLGCGHLTQTLDEAGLAAVRVLARRQDDGEREKP